jgi:hypothetical protein
MFEMEDLPMKARQRDLNKPIPPKRLSQGKRELMSKPFPPRRMPPTARQTTARATKKQAARVGSRPVKKLPPMRTPGEQPRDSFGRFARKTGAVLWGAAKGTVKAVKGTAKAVGKAHKSVTRVQANARRRASLEATERKIALVERERKAGMKRKKIRRRRK